MGQRLGLLEPREPRVDREHHGLRGVVSKIPSVRLPPHLYEQPRGKEQTQ